MDDVVAYFLADRWVFDDSGVPHGIPQWSKIDAPGGIFGPFGAICGSRWVVSRRFSNFGLLKVNSASSGSHPGSILG